MKVFLQPPKHMSLAMFRVANALQYTAPTGVEVVRSENEADLTILHVIGPDAVTHRPDKPCAVLQYCVGTGGGEATYRPLWARAAAVWSYYDLRPAMPEGARFYYAPLGVADIFTEPFEERKRGLGILTSGYVTGPGAEAIEEPTRACEFAGLRSVHLGPVAPIGGNDDVRYNVTGLIPDERLAMIYRLCRYVSGLRYVEGFELPAVEGLACGARPVMFDRPDARAWFNDHAVFVPECGGTALVNALVDVLLTEPKPVMPDERRAVLDKFNWDTLAAGFWTMLTEGVNA